MFYTGKIIIYFISITIIFHLLMVDVIFKIGNVLPYHVEYSAVFATITKPSLFSLFLFLSIYHPIKLPKEATAQRNIEIPSSKKNANIGGF